MAGLDEDFSHLSDHCSPKKHRKLTANCQQSTEMEDIHVLSLWAQHSQRVIWTFEEHITILASQDVKLIMVGFLFWNRSGLNGRRVGKPICLHIQENCTQYMIIHLCKVQYYEQYFLQNKTILCAFQKNTLCNKTSKNTVQNFVQRWTVYEQNMCAILFKSISVQKGAIFFKKSA